MCMEIKNKVFQGDVLDVLSQFPDESVDCVVTSPPYHGLRDYGVEGQIGLEKTFTEYLDKMLAITLELKRVLKKTGTMWWNHGDSYGGNGMEKSLLLQAHRLAIRMIDEQGWILRNTIIWHKPNVMPQSVKDRFTVDYEPVFFFTKSKKYWFEQQFEPMNFKESDYRTQIRKNADQYNIKKPYENNYPKSFNPNGRTKRCVWEIPTQSYPESHFATFPEELIVTPIKAGCPKEICKKCGIGRERIIKAEGGSIGKSWHEHSKDMEVGAGQISRIGDCVDEVGRKYQRIDLGYTDCGCNAGWDSGVVLDPFSGSGTTAYVARKLLRNYVGIELNPEYIKLAEKRLAQQLLV